MKVIAWKKIDAMSGLSDFESIGFTIPDWLPPLVKAGDHVKVVSEEENTWYVNGKKVCGSRNPE